MEKAALVAAHGIEVGLAVTAYPEKLEEIEEAVAFALGITLRLLPAGNLWRDVNRMPPIRGDLTEGMSQKQSRSRLWFRSRRSGPRNSASGWRSDFQLTPFASLGSNQDPADPRWLSFMVATVHQQGEAVRLSEPAGDLAGMRGSGLPVSRACSM